MLCCGCLFVELIDRREGVLWKQKRNTGEGQGGGGLRVVFLKGCGLFPWLIEGGLCLGYKPVIMGIKQRTGSSSVLSWAS